MGLSQAYAELRTGNRIGSDVGGIVVSSGCNKTRSKNAKNTSVEFFYREGAFRVVI
jgi:hypothetical protein